MPALPRSAPSPRSSSPGSYFAPLLAVLTQGPLHFSIGAGFSVILLIGMLAGEAVSAILGLLVGLPTLRLRGDYLAIATLGFGEIMADFFQNFRWNEHAIFGGSTGLSLIGMRGEWLADQPDASTLAPLVQNFQDNTDYFVGAFPVFAVALLTIFIVRNIKYATSGRALWPCVKTPSPPRPSESPPPATRSPHLSSGRHCGPGRRADLPSQIADQSRVVPLHALD